MSLVGSYDLDNGRTNTPNHPSPSFSIVDPNPAGPSYQFYDLNSSWNGVAIDKTTLSGTYSDGTDSHLFTISDGDGTATGITCTLSDACAPKNSDGAGGSWGATDHPAPHPGPPPCQSRYDAYAGQASQDPA